MLLGFLQVRRFCCRKGSYFSLEERQHRVFASQFDNCSSEGLQQRFFCGKTLQVPDSGKNNVLSISEWAQNGAEGAL